MSKFARKLAILSGFVLTAGLALAQEPSGQQPGHEPPMAQPQTTPGKTPTREVTAQVVSADPVAKTITIKKEGNVPGMTGGESTLPVEIDAVTALKTVMPGEKVKLECRTDSTGKETSVTGIRKFDKSSTKPNDQP